MTALQRAPLPDFVDDVARDHPRVLLDVRIYSGEF